MVIFIVWIKFEMKCKDFFNFKLFEVGSAEMLQLMFDNGLKFNVMPDSLLQNACVHMFGLNETKVICNKSCLSVFAFVIIAFSCQ